MPQHKHYNPNFLHHQHSFPHIYGREIVFGMASGFAIGHLVDLFVQR